MFDPRDGSGHRAYSEHVETPDLASVTTMMKTFGGM